MQERDRMNKRSRMPCSCHQRPQMIQRPYTTEVCVVWTSNFSARGFPGRGCYVHNWSYSGVRHWRAQVQSACRSESGMRPISFMCILFVGAWLRPLQGACTTMGTAHFPAQPLYNAGCPVRCDMESGCWPKSLRPLTCWKKIPLQSDSSSARISHPLEQDHPLQVIAAEAVHAATVHAEMASNKSEVLGVVKHWVAPYSVRGRAAATGE